MSGSIYLHLFLDEPLSIYGTQDLTATLPGVHGRQITLTSHDPTISHPPVGTFDWHYIQCVLKKFASPDYQGLQNIYAFTFPFHTQEDEDEDDSVWDLDDERHLKNPPYPSYYWDLARWRQSKHLDEEERNNFIMAWHIQAPRERRKHEYIIPTESK